MEIRLLQYFITVAREESITKAAQVLHITQPTLSRQLAELEDELQVKLFTRGKRKLTLTDEGILLQRRAQEILQLVDKTKEDLSENNVQIQGTVTIGCGEFSSVKTIAAMMKSFLDKYPNIHLDILTATAGTIKEQLNKGIMDFGVLMGNLDKDEYECISLPVSEKWVAVMRKDDPLSEKDKITVNDLVNQKIILPRYYQNKNDLSDWFGQEMNQMNVQIRCDLSSNAAVMVDNGMGYYICLEGFLPFWDKDKLVFRPLYPSLTANTILAWKKNQIYSPAVTKLIEFIHACKA